MYQYTTLKADTGDTGHYIREKYAAILNNLEPTRHVPCVIIPNNSIIKPTKQGNIPLHNLPPQANCAHLFYILNSVSLLYIGELCDSDCAYVFTKTYVTIFNSINEPVLNGQRNHSDGLWDNNISSTQQS